MANRTPITLVFLPPAGDPGRNSIEGSVAQAKSFAITGDSETTAAIYLGGLVPWRRGRPR